MSSAKRNRIFGCLAFSARPAENRQSKNRTRMHRHTSQFEKGKLESILEDEIVSPQAANRNPVLLSLLSLPVLALARVPAIKWLTAIAPAEGLCRCFRRCR